MIFFKTHKNFVKYNDLLLNMGILYLFQNMENFVKYHDLPPSMEPYKEP